MIECIFTIDYEIYGNGAGSLKDLVYEPTAELIRLFEERDHRFACFVEALEFQKIRQAHTDTHIEAVCEQIQKMYRAGFEIALHLHPQWMNARHEGMRWLLDYSEYNLCVLPERRIREIVEAGISFLREAVQDPGFNPVSFRAGNWLFQPSHLAASILSDFGLKIDSSVFKGGVQRKHQLDYRRSLRNPSYWQFTRDVNIPDAGGSMWEIPIYAEMVPIWRMFTKKRVSLQKAAPRPGSRLEKLSRVRDLLRFKFPLKFDFCRMTLEELIGITNRVLARHERDPHSFLPMVAIGHSKDLNDFETVRRFLDYLAEKNISVSTFAGVFRKYMETSSPTAALA
jgi:hypothetical protein